VKFGLGLPAAIRTGQRQTAGVGVPVATTPPGGPAIAAAG